MMQEADAGLGMHGPEVEQQTHAAGRHVTATACKPGHSIKMARIARKHGQLNKHKRHKTPEQLCIEWMNSINHVLTMP